MQPSHIIRQLIQPVLTRPNDLKVVEEPLAGGGTCITVTPHGADMPRLVGKGGVNVRALKAIAESLSTDSKRVVLILADPPHQFPGARPTPPTLKWNTEPVATAIKGVLEAIGRKSMVNVVGAGSEEVSFVVPLQLTGTLTEALGRWVSVMAHSLGGTAFLRTSNTTVTPALK